MAKPRIVRYGGGELAFTLNKVDRARLYGYKETEVLDEQDRKCELATLADDGRTVVGRGGSGLGYLSADGEWCEKSALKPIDLEGNEISPVVSSYSAPIEQIEPATVDDYLAHNIRLLYLLESESDLATLRQELAKGVILKFPYSYRGGLEADAGFLLAADDWSLFMAVGNPTRIELIGLQQVAVVEEEENDVDETDLMDFGMM